MSASPHIPLLVNFTHEDKSAKGLRSLREAHAVAGPPVYFTAREIIDNTTPLLLLGARGSGKTELARRLTAAGGFHHVEIAGPANFEALAAGAPAGATLVLDGVDRLGADGPAVLAEALARVGQGRLLALGETATVKSWLVPSGYQIHTLMPLSRQQRESFLADSGRVAPAALSDAAATPALFALALGLEGPVGSAEELIAAWLDTQSDPGLPRTAFAAIAAGRSRNRAVDDLLAARHLLTLSVDEVSRRFHMAPEVWGPSVASLTRLFAPRAELLAERLLGGSGDSGLAGALIVAVVLDDASPLRPRVAASLERLIETGRLSAFDRDRAARILSRWGDPRDFDALAEVPAGSFTFGSDTHPNSAPPHRVTVGAFRIGVYPVTNAQYGGFTIATDRPWGSPEAHVPDRANAPAVELSWHDARAYCAWLTGRWRAAGRIGADEMVRLPTEPEWERAARGDQPDAGDSIVYPWGGTWESDAANSEETGFNGTCAVGLFPKGRSPYGCYDMAGEVWEWTTTLWGDNMTTPSFRYPYAGDGREDPDAGPAIRRVLRGGCFSSTSRKTCCTYRGSLEPNGSWRGNGFRIVVARG